MSFLGGNSFLILLFFGAAAAAAGAVLYLCYLAFHFSPVCLRNAALPIINPLDFFGKNASQLAARGIGWGLKIELLNFIYFKKFLNQLTRTKMIKIEMKTLNFQLS
jgi:hypothetical protein